MKLSSIEWSLWLEHHFHLGAVTQCDSAQRADLAPDIAAALDAAPDAAAFFDSLAQFYEQHGYGGSTRRNADRMNARSGSPRWCPCCSKDTRNAPDRAQ